MQMCLSIMCAEPKPVTDLLTYWIKCQKTPKKQTKNFQSHRLTATVKVFIVYYTVCIIVLVLYVILFVATEAFAH